MYPFFRWLLFKLDPETAHSLMLKLVRLSGGLPPMCNLLRTWFSAPQREVGAFGLVFPNPVGLAAGYDKDGLGWRGLACLGFGHIEVGTITPRAQAGNPRPRLFRLVEDEALINRMGFPGRGAAFVKKQLAGSRPPRLVLGVNIGKNLDTPLEEAAQDYLELARVFAPLSDYLAINISSPNTIGLRRLQARDALDELVSCLVAERRLLVDRLGKKIPMLVKLAPDLTSAELEDALQVILQHGIDGVIATNTTLSREGLRSRLEVENGGLSGVPLHAMSLAKVSEIHRLTQGRLPIIGVGGINGVDRAQAMLDSGATLVQVYTGLVYAGPGLVKKILAGIH